MKLPRAHHLPIDLLVGQTIMPALNIQFLNRDAHEVRRILQYVRKFHIGGFILFGGHPTDVHYWIQRLQNESELPLLFAADL